MMGTGSAAHFPGDQHQPLPPHTSAQPDRVWMAPFDALGAHIAILDRDGVIVAVNAAWRSFADANGLGDPAHAIGANYLTVCDRAAAAGDQSALEVAAAIRAVLSGACERFTCRYPCHAPHEVRWFSVTVAPLDTTDRVRVIVAHENETPLIRSEQERERLLAELTERVKELTAVHGTVSALNRPGRQLEEMLREIETLLPNAMRFPELAAARISLDASLDADTSVPLLRATFSDGAALTGAVEVTYFGDLPGAATDPFLPEELALLESVAGMIGAHLQRERALSDLQRSEHRFRSLVQNATDVVALVDPDGAIVYASPSFEIVLGYQPEALAGVNVFNLLVPDDVERAAEAFERLLRAPGESVTEQIRLRHADGSERWLEATGRNLLDDPAISAVVVNSRDTTERVEMEARRLMLATISDVLSESLDLDTTFQQIARQIVPTFADWCSVVMLDTDGVPRRVALEHRDPEKARLLDELAAHPLDLRSEHGMARSIRTGESTIYPEIPEDYWAPPVSAAYVHLHHELGMRSAMSVPLIARGEIVGGVALTFGDSGRRYAEPDLEMALEIAGRAAIAIDNAHLYQTSRAAEEDYRTLVEQVPAVMYRTPIGQDDTIYLSPRMEQMLGYTAEEWQSPGTLRWDAVYPEDRARLRAAFDEADRTLAHTEIEYRYISEGGEVVWVRNSAHVVRGDNGTPLFWQGFITDVTAQKAAEAALRESEARFRSAFDDAAVGMAIIGLDRRIISVNPALGGLLGYAPDDLIGVQMVDLSHPDDIDIVVPHRQRILGEASSYQIEKRYIHRSGAIVWCIVSTTAVRGHDGSPLYLVTQFQDITERKELELQLSHQALHDSLTGLPNRTLLMDRLDRAISTARRHGGTVAVLFLDLDNFKLINDSLGHANGDEVLVGIAGRLRRCLRDEDTVARFGGDEFLVMLGQIAHPVEAVEVADRILESLRMPLRVQGRDVIMSPSIGIALSEDGRHDRDELVRHADIAMYRAKSAGKGNYHLFDADMQGEALQRLELEHDLRRALERDEFFLVFQPIVSLKSGQVREVEALIRWQHPQRGVVGPGDFITVAEETGMILPIGNWVLREACAQAAAWQALAGEGNDLRVSVNLSARQFRQPNLVAQVREALEHAEFPAHLLVLELTETDLMECADQAVMRLQELRSLGVMLAIDDFGTGYSSLSHLHSFPVEVLKIDRSFVSRIGAEQDSTPIVSATVRLAQALGMRTVAEGIETEEQFLTMQREGCDMAQGYYFSQPLAAEDLAKYLLQSAGSEW